MRFGILLMLTIFCQIGFGQTLVQNIKGTIKDKDSKQPLIGATVQVLETTKGGVTDINGVFKIIGVEVGRVSIQASFLGYEPLLISNIELTTAKELILNIEMQESMLREEEVVILAERDKTQPNNELASVSVRKFSVEESMRFAGARNDVSRMAANFAGVQASNDQANDIVIRGNSPNSLLWRMEGVDIPNPNHFGDFGSTGGPVSMLNNNVLANSDFYTGAFPANYGNTIAGVFDLSLRNGNNEKHEFLGQVGFNGFELGAEGPISRANGSSYLVNARYSTLEAMQHLGLDVGTGTAVPKYKDITFKINLPINSRSQIAAFGLAGSSSIDFLNSEKDSSQSGDLWSAATLDIYDRTRMAVVGANYTLLLSKKAYWKTTVAYTTQVNADVVDSVAPATREVFEFYNQDFNNSKVFVNTFYNHKFNPRNTLRVGLIANQLIFNLHDSVYQNEQQSYQTLTNSQGSTHLVQGYANLNHRFTERLTLKAGLNNQWLLLNNSYSFEPRLGLQYNASKRLVLSFGYGLHSYMTPLNFYFVEEPIEAGRYERPNDDLDFAKSHHLVLGASMALPRGYFLKAETYYQQIFDAVVGADPNSTFSMLNMASFDFSAPDRLKNGGTGENYGVEVTIEKFLTKGFYFLSTTSLFKSTYVPTNGKSFNTKFDNRYVANLLGGKEWRLGKKGNKYLAFDLKGTYAGGQRYTPILLEASRQAGEAVYDTENPYSQQFNNYFRVDGRLAFRVMGKGIVQEWAIDVQNATDQQNALFQQYNSATQEVDVSYQLGRFPLMQYRIQF